MTVTSHQQVGPPLAWFAVAYAIGHHVGTVFEPLGEVGPTRWADWIDLAVPLAVLGAAAVVLLRSGADRRCWWVFAVGALLYTQGQALHLGTNSISNTDPTGRTEDATHLWDENVSHHIWYTGAAIVVAALFLATRSVPIRVRPWAWLGVAAVGFTWMTNSVEGGAVPLCLTIAVGYTILGWRVRDRGAGRLLAAAFGLSTLLLSVFGIWQGGYPQFSELGWI